MGVLAVAAVDLIPSLGDRQDGLHFAGEQPVDGVAARSSVLEGAEVAVPGLPPVDPSETCHTEHAQAWARPSATASSTVVRTSSLTSAWTRAGSGPLSPRPISPDDRQFDGLRLDRLG